MERLSSAGLLVVHRGLREKWTFSKMIQELSSATGEKVAQSSLARYASRWELQSRSLQEVQEQAGAFIAEIKAGSLGAAEVAGALITQALFDTREMLAEADPIKLSREERERQKLELKREELQLRRREIEFNERKLEAMEAKHAALRKAAEGVKEIAEGTTGELTSGARQKIREIYGLATE